jgi:adenylyltransferase/sulfurtransferase
VLGVLPGIVAMIQATETVKLLTGMGESLIGRLLQFDALQMTFQEFRLRRDPECPVCGEHPSIRELIDYEGFCGMGHDDGLELVEISAVEVRALQERGEEFVFLDVRGPDEYETARIEGARLLPLGELEERLGELEGSEAKRVVVHCHHGGRSAQACRVLQQHGWSEVRNLAGGIEAWSLTVDPSVPRY